MVRNAMLAAVAVLATAAAGCAATVDEATPAPETTIANEVAGYETQIPDPRDNPNEKWVETFRCYTTEQGVDPMVRNAKTNVQLVPPDVTVEDVVKAFQEPLLDPLAKCF